MLNSFTALRARVVIALALALTGAMIFTPAVAQDDGIRLDVLELQTTFSVNEAPEPPYHAHQSMLFFPPGAEAPLHFHGGPGYITILQGELTLVEDDEETVYVAGDSVIETVDKLYKGGNYTATDTVLMVTYLVPEGEEITTVVDDPESPEPPAIVSEPLAETMHEFDEPPSSFDLIHRSSIYEPGDVTENRTADGDILLTLVTGKIEVTIDDELYEVGPNEYVLIETDSEYSLINTGDSNALTMSTELSPTVYGVVPETGSAVDRTFAMWLLVLTASAMLVVASVLRLTAIRMR